MTNSSALRAAIENAGVKYKYVAKVLGLSSFGLQKKIDGVTEFKASKIVAFFGILDLPLGEWENIFLPIKVI